MDQGIEITGRDRESEHISVQKTNQAMHYQFTLIKRISHCIWRKWRESVVDRHAKRTLPGPRRGGTTERPLQPDPSRPQISGKAR